jgi:hypothetical protein
MKTLVARFMQDFFKIVCHSLRTFLESFMLFHEYVDELHICCNDRLNTYSCWSLALEITLSYVVGSTT